MYFSQFIGVDISKNTLDAAIYPAKDKKLDFLHFDNTQKGLGEMLSWLKRRGVKPSEKRAEFPDRRGKKNVPSRKTVIFPDAGSLASRKDYQKAGIPPHGAARLVGFRQNF